MATRSRIAIQLNEKEVMSIYCHWDGYPYGIPGCVGQVLANHYTTRDRVFELMEHGDVSVLAEHIHPSQENHNFSTPEDGVCIFYGRDRGDTLPGAQTKSIDEFDRTLGNMCEEYVYIMDLNGNWTVADLPFTEDGQGRSTATTLLRENFPKQNQ